MDYELINNTGIQNFESCNHSVSKNVKYIKKNPNFGFVGSLNLWRTSLAKREKHYNIDGWENLTRHTHIVWWKNAFIEHEI